MKYHQFPHATFAKAKNARNHVKIQINKFKKMKTTIFNNNNDLN